MSKTKYLVKWVVKSGPFEGMESGCVVYAESRGEAVCAVRDAHPTSGELIGVEKL